MSLLGYVLDLTATTLRLRKPRRPEGSGRPRILVIRRNRIGDMVCTVPLLHALRRHHPNAHIAVACDPVAAPVAQSCEALNEVVVLASGWNPWQAAYRNAAALQGYDIVIAAKGGFDRKLGVLTRLTNAPTRIGFQNCSNRGSLYYTDPVPIPENLNEEHQIETLLQLLRPTGMVRTTAFSVNLSLKVPAESEAFASDLLSRPPFTQTPGYVMINYSSTAALKLREEDFIALARRILGATHLAIAFVAAPRDQQLIEEIAMCMASKRVIAVQTPGPMDLAALLARALVIITPEGGAAHLAAALNTPALVIWSEGPFKKWRSRGRRHTHVQAEAGEKLMPFLNAKAANVDDMMADVFEQPPEMSS
jgi:ADP-heptose:LPS heptosyltransferase